MPEHIIKIIEEFMLQVHKSIQDHLCESIIYGSYARGDFNENSDIDIMILVNAEDAQIKKYEDELCDRAFDMELAYGIVISPIVKNQVFFEYWSDTLPFYRNIKREGIKVA